MMGYDDNPIYEQSSAISTNSLLSQVFFRMFLGLLATAIAAGVVYYTGALYDFATSGGFIFCLIAEIVVALVFSLGFTKLPSGVVTALFYTYSILTGITFSVLFVAYELSSIVYAFIGTAAIFGVMAYIGKNTNTDLTNLGTILTISLIVAIVVSIINLFFANSIIDIILDWVVIAIFMGFTVYDMNKIIQMKNLGITDDEHIYVYGAMQLYLDYINIFLRILSIFGKRRN